jgi:hypothetical protein
MYFVLLYFLASYWTYDHRKKSILYIHTLQYIVRLYKFDFVWFSINKGPTKDLTEQEKLSDCMYIQWWTSFYTTCEQRKRYMHEERRSETS